VSLLRSAIALIFLATACAPTASLRVAPETVCAGRNVRLTWEGSGPGELSASPADPALGSVGERGMKTAQPKVSTTYRLRVSTLLASATSETSVTVVSVPPQPAAIRASIADESSGCAPGRIWVTARVPADAWSPRLRVNQVFSADGRAYRIEHAAGVAQVTPDEPSNALSDLPVTGAWRLETPLRPGEICGEASAPESLAVNVSFVCAD
jgi:hypothetical protein